MSSPTITALDFLLVSLGLAPLKILGSYFFEWRRKRRKKRLHQALQEAEEEGE